MTDGHGLTLKIQTSGTKCWVLRISSGGRVTDLALGHWPEVSLMQARQIARRKRKELGQEPPRGYTLRDAWSLWKNLKRGRIVSYQDEKRRMERYIIGPLGSRQIDEITAPLVIQTVKPIEKAGHQATLKRVLMRTREVMDLAVCAGYITHNPIERVSKVFAPPVVKPMPAVPWSDLPNITGTFGVFQNTDKFYVDNVVFTSNTSIGRRGPQGTDDGICTNFNATGASSIYGQSSTVQPKALHLLPCIKI